MTIKIPDYSSLRMMVYGDVMLDRYCHGRVSRISPEAPVPIVSVGHSETRLGGAANVAFNLSKLGASVTLIGALGDDEEGKIVLSLLTAQGINYPCSPFSDYTTVTKLRVLSQNQQLLRLDFEKYLRMPLREQLIAQYQRQFCNVDSVILSDYDKGTLSRDALSVIQKAREHGLPVWVDPKSTDFTRYAGATVLTPNFKEFSAVVGNCATDAIMIEKAHQLIKSHRLEALLITQGPKGLTLVEKDKAAIYFPASGYEVYDVTGAGDTVISVMAASTAAGCSMAHAAKLANIAGGMVVSKLGVSAVTALDVQRELQRSQQDATEILTRDDLLSVVSKARAHGEKIVMTNGCFDILHWGHLQYLSAAKALGDRLIVAVNDDGSVARLKGKDRPLNTLSARMALLAALQVVDWVVSFSEDTPFTLIKAVLPDILVKGADYQAEDVIGADIIRQYGGQVLTIPVTPEYSTSRLIKKMQEITS